METITFSDLNSLYKWIVFIVNTKQAKLEGVNYQLNIFGEDNAYLIINKYETETRAIEYYFKPNDTKNGLLALFSILETINFSLEKLIEELQVWNFNESDMGDHFVIGDIHIFRDVVESN